MKFTKYFQNMYYVTIAVLLIIAIAASITFGSTINLIVAVVTASILDIAIKKLWLKRKPVMPLSAIITGLIIGSVMVWKNAPVSGVLIAVIIAIFSKFAIRLRGSHIFNPAVFGVVISMILTVGHGAAAIAHGASQAVAGFAPGGFPVPLVLVPLLLFANYKARKLWTSIPFLIVSALLFYFTGLASLDASNTQNIFTFLEVLPWYFAFIIVSDPRTSPYVKNEQAVFGIGIAILSILPLLIWGFYSHILALAALLLGNLIYAIYRVAIRRYPEGTKAATPR